MRHVRRHVHRHVHRRIHTGGILCDKQVSWQVDTRRRSERSPYIAERAQSMHGLTRGEMLKMYYKNELQGCFWAVLASLMGVLKGSILSLA